MQPKTVTQMMQEARERVENLPPERVAAELEQGNAILIDLREPGEQTQHGVIPGAISAPRGMLEFWADPSSPYHRQEFDPQRRTILYCASGGRSALAAATLQELGYTNVAHLAGGVKAWAEEGRPMTKHIAD